MSKIQRVFKHIFTYGGYKDILSGLGNTFIIAFAGLAIGIVIGTLIASVRVSKSNNPVIRILRGFCTAYVGFFRGTPIVVQLLLFYYALPGFTGISINKLLCAVLCFGINSGAYVSEIMRAGILSVDKGQTEAGRSLGMSYLYTMFYVVMPQAIKNIIPTLGNELIVLVKETSVVSFIAIVDITKVFQNLANNTYENIFTYCLLAVIYLVIVTILSVIIRAVERRLRKGDKR